MRNLRVTVLMMVVFMVGGVVWGQTYTTSGSFPVPAGVYSITVECWGGGGGGGFARSTNGAAGGGGGGGAYTRSTVAVTPGANINFTIGAGGTRGLANGTIATAGGVTTFSSATPVLANGGGFGAGVNTNSSGAGGAGGTGGTNNGGTGGNGVNGTGAAAGGGGGGGSAGTANNGNNGAGKVGGVAVAGGGAGGNGVSGAPGNAGTVPGGGGSGGNRVSNPGGNQPGSNGAGGQITVSYTRPTVTSVSSSTADGTYKIGDIIAVTVQFSEAVTVTGTPQLTLETGTTDRTVNYTSGSGSGTLTFNYTVQAGDVNADLDYVATTSLTLNGGTIRNAAGNDAILTLPAPGAANSLGANKAIRVDGVVPTVAITSAVTNPTNSSPFSITITFSEAISGFTNADFALVNCSASAPSTADNIIFTSNITPTANGTVNVTVNANTVIDAAGNSNTVSNLFVTVYDNVAPTVSALNPLDDATNVGANDNLILTFGENVQLGTAGNIVIYNSGGTVFETIPYNDVRISFLTNTVTINPTGTFALNSSYYVQIAATAIRDMAGNNYAGINNTTSWNFTVPYPYFRSRAAGPANWNAAATWETSPDNITWSNAALTPTDANSPGITIRAGHTVTVSASVQADDITVDGILSVSAAQTLTVANGAAATDMTVSATGTVSNAWVITPTGTISFSGTYTHARDAGTIPSATWNAGSTCNITGYTTNAPGGLGQSFSNFTFNCNTRTLTLAATLAVGGNLTITAGTIAAAAQTINLGGDLAGAGALTFTSGTLNIGGNNTHSGTFTYGTGTVNYNGASQQVRGTTYYNLTASNGGTKTMQGAVTVNNILNLSNGNISLGSGANNLTLINGATITNSGSFDNTHMIVCDGTGSLIKQSTTSAALVRVYPVGTNGFYSPFEITSLTATVTGTGSVNVRAVTGSAPGPPAADGTDLKKYWVITTPNLSAINANAGFTYVDPDEVGVGGDQTSYQPFLYSGGAWSLATGASSGGVNPMTTTGSAILAGTWTGREGPTTYYSYQSGNWATDNTWTTDPSGTLSVSPSVPGALDRAVILNGRTVTATAGQTVMSTQINEGGFLDIGTSTGHNLGVLRGQGWLRLSSNTFPGNTSSADFVSASGGTVEYYDLDANRLSNTQLTYNNLIVSNNTANPYTVYLDNSANPINYTVNGNFTLKNNSSGSLIFRFGNPTASNNKINLTVHGDFTVNAGCTIQVNNFAAGQAYNDVHNLTLYGDLTNNGTIRFTGLPSPVANGYYLLGTTTFGGQNYGAVKVTFAGSTSNTVNCNGVTDFYRFIVDKGIDQSYMVDVNSSATADFGLYGPNNQGGNLFDGGPEGYGTGVYEKALFIYHGTLKLNDNINIPTITEGGQDFNLIPTACLWVNGATVSTTLVGVNGTGYQAATLYGKIMVSAGSFSTGDAAGIVLGSSATPEIYVDGTGTFSASQVWSAGSGNKISYIQTGGTTNIRANGEYHAGYMLGLSNTNTVFTMTGGTLNFINAVNDGSLGMDLRAATGNYTVTGGTVNINLPGGTTFDINTTVPFYNLVVTRSGGAGTLTARFLNTSSTTISVLNDLTLNANTALNAGTNTVNLNVGHNFLLDAASAYTSGNNTTTFNGAGGQIFTNAGIISAGTGLYNLVLSNTSNTDINTNNLIVRNDLTINSGCYLNDMGKTISVAGHILNSGTHRSQAGGGVMLNGTLAQTIGGSGDGIFGNLIINKTAGTASLTANQALTGNLRLVNGVLQISTFKLSLGSASNVYDALYPAVTAAFSGAKMIVTAGNMSDGGVTKTYGAATAFVFPVGTGADYTPATIQFSSAQASCAVNVKPVAQFNPFVTSTNSLNYYWKVTQSGFSGSGTVSHTYHYVDSDTTGRGYAINYIPGVYNPFGWTYINDISQVVDATNDIHFTNVNYLAGDFTAGELDAFQPVTVFYSCATGNWDQLGTWSNTSNAGPADATVLPGAGNPVVIGDGGSNNHVVTIPAGFDNVTIGGLQINSGSTLDITTTTGHNFGAIPDSKITGNGLLKISSALATAAFPGGDFGNFLSTGGGTVEYYSTGLQDFTLPVAKTYYNNLVLSPTAGRYISMPDINTRVYNDYTISGTGLTGIARLNAAAPRTLTVDGDINVTGGTLQYYNGTAQTVYANDDISVSSGASFEVRNGGVAVNNLLYADGNLTNNGNFDMYASATLVANVYFTGNADKAISRYGDK